MNAIVRDAKELNTLVSRTIKTGERYRTDQHLAVVSTIVHAMEHGDIRLLNRLNTSFTKNDQEALRLYIRRIHYEIGGIPVLNRKDGDYVVINANGNPAIMDARKSVVTLADRLLACKDGDKWKADPLGKSAPIQPFYAKNNLVEIQTFGDKQAWTAISRLYKLVHGEGPETTTVGVSSKMVKLIDRFTAEAEMFMKANEHGTTTADLDKNEAEERAKLVEAASAKVKEAKAKARKANAKARKANAKARKTTTVDATAPAGEAVS